LGEGFAKIKVGESMAGHHIVDQNCGEIAEISAQ
jgi:hypothetical protein